MSFTNSLYHSNKGKKEITMTGKFADLWRFVITYSILIYHHSNSFYPSNNISPYFVPFYNAYVDLNNSGICMVFGNYHLMLIIIIIIIIITIIIIIIIRRKYGR